MSKIIIGIHGLGNKPPKTILTDWWKKSILEGLKKFNHSSTNFEFEMVYWADIFHPIPLDPDEVNKSSPLYLKNRYLPENALNSNESSRLRIKAREYFDKFYGKIVVNEVLSLKYPSLTDLFFHLNMRDLENYYSTFYINHNGIRRLAKQEIIERLSESLKKHKGKKILLISHSMGSIIAHDALIDNLLDLKIDTLISVGSPLGQKYVLRKILEEQKDNLGNKLKVPENIRRNWYNLSDLDDQVALNHLLAELYVSNSKGVKIIDKLVQNNSKVNGTRDPHSSFGYLRTPEFAEIVHSFLSRKRFNLFIWFNFASSK
jgi:hypothetical protein